MKINLLFIGFLLLSSIAFAQKEEIIVLKNGFESAVLEDKISVYKQDRLSSVEDIYRIPSSRFEPTQSVQTLAPDKKHYWLKLNLNSEIEQNLILEYQQVFIEDIDFYLFKNDTLIDKDSSSVYREFGQKKVPSRYHAFSFSTQKKAHYVILIHCHNSNIKYSNRAFVELFTVGKYYKNADYFLINNMMANGCSLLAGILAFIFFIYSRKSIYLFYGFYAISVIPYSFSYLGVLNQYLTASFWATTKFSSFISLLIIVFHQHYVFVFLKIEQVKKPWIKYAHFVFLGLCFVQILLVTFVSDDLIPTGYYYLSFCCFIIIFVGISLLKKQVEAYLYLLASGPMFIAFFLIILGSMGVVNIKRFLFYYTSFIFLIELIGLGLALLYRINKDKNKVETELEKNRIETTQKILLAQEEERQKLALDLHDDLGGSLSVLNSELNDLNDKNAQIFTKSVNLIKKIVSDLRTISHHLMPSLFEEKGLIKVVQESIEMANRQSKIYFIFLYNGEERRFSRETEINIYRIIKELINNILKHSEATQAVVQMIYFEDFLYVSVEDDGKGFDFLKHETWGIGLNNINLRTKYLKAKLSTESSSVGTLMSLEIPYNAHEN